MAQTARVDVRGRGRPARLSREQIIAAAVGLARSDPGEPLTIKRVAEAARAAPMALYRYFPDRDDLLHAVADRIMADMPFEAPQGASWQEELRAWMEHGRATLVPYPQLVPYMAGTHKPAWLPSFAVLRRMLAPLRLGDDDLALAVTLVGSTVVGHAMLEARRRPVADTQASLRAALAELAEADRAEIGPLLDRLPGAYDRLYDTVISRTIAAVEDLSPRHVAPPRRGRRPPPDPTYVTFSDTES
ncbi:MAG: TetR/AcrR family transcriptional regulator [Streptomycetaceae bacterium]|nr:TetR/AcrR family transcriptional regulator [Streptomycetaceae bacterium]